MSKSAVALSVCAVAVFLSLCCELLSQTRQASAASYIERGIQYQRQGLLDRAIADYTIAIEFDPRSALAHYNRGSAHQQRDELMEAIADYSKAIEIDP